MSFYVSILFFIWWKIPAFIFLLSFLSFSECVREKGMRSSFGGAQKYMRTIMDNFIYDAISD